MAGGLLRAQAADAQTPSLPELAYGQSSSGEVTDPQGERHYFTGCVGETVGVSVTSDDFAPHLQLFAPTADHALASVAAAANGKTAQVDGVQLSQSGLYLIAVSGRTRGVRGSYTVTLQGTGPDNPLPNDGDYHINLSYGDTLTGTLDANQAEQYNFRGCAGDQIRARSTPAALIRNSICSSRLPKTPSPAPSTSSASATAPSTISKKWLNSRDAPLYMPPFQR